MPISAEIGSPTISYRECTRKSGVLPPLLVSQRDAGNFAPRVVIPLVASCTQN